MVHARPAGLVVITGPMFSGKTSRLIELLEREMLAGNRIVLFKPEIDDRYSKSEVATHKGITLPAVVSPIGKRATEFIKNRAKLYDVIGIDEAQFWTTDANLPELLNELTFSGKRVYVSMVNRDITGKPFDAASRLLPLADEVHALTAICNVCGGEATFTQRVSKGRAVFGPVIKVGGKEMYEPRCRSCFVPKRKRSRAHSN